jgi:hypothetical protein
MTTNWENHGSLALRNIQVAAQSKRFQFAEFIKFLILLKRQPLFTKRSVQCRSGMQLQRSMIAVLAFGGMEFGDPRIHRKELL